MMKKIKLPLSKVRKLLKYFPINKDWSLDFTPSNPLITIVKKEEISKRFSIDKDGNIFRIIL